MTPETKILALLARYGGDILSAAAMRTQENYTQHGTTSVYLHCVNVAYISVQLALFLRLHVNYRALVRGALLHDYFLYDWHVPSETHRGHGFTHAHTALRNASRDFTLNAVERDVIARHMFPLNLTPPRYRESVLVCLADKFCAVTETLRLPIPDADVRRFCRRYPIRPTDPRKGECENEGSGSQLQHR